MGCFLVGLCHVASGFVGSKILQLIYCFYLHLWGVFEGKRAGVGDAVDGGGSDSVLGLGSGTKRQWCVIDFVLGRQVSETRPDWQLFKLEVTRVQV